MVESSTDPASSFLHEDELIRGIEMLFYAYRDFTSDPDEILKAYGFGRAHHRVVHFVGRNPGMTVTELLAILKVTKQSLNRVLSQLVAEEFIAQEKGSRDRRQRREELMPWPHPTDLDLQNQYRERDLHRKTAHNQSEIHGAQLRRTGAGDQEKRDDPGKGSETRVDHVLQPQRSGPEQGRSYCQTETGTPVTERAWPGGSGTGRGGHGGAGMIVGSERDHHD